MICSKYKNFQAKLTKPKTFQFHLKVKAQKITKCHIQRPMTGQMNPCTVLLQNQSFHQSSHHALVCIWHMKQTYHIDETSEKRFDFFIICKNTEYLLLEYVNNCAVHNYDCYSYLLKSFVKHFCFHNVSFSNVLADYGTR